MTLVKKGACIPHFTRAVRTAKEQGWQPEVTGTAFRLDLAIL